MAFYKLFCILHRRTDWERLLDWERQIMLPEWYEERKQRTSELLYRLAMPFGICKTMLDGKTEFI